MKNATFFLTCATFVAGCYKTSVDLSPLVDGGADAGTVVEDAALDMRIGADMAADMAIDVDAGDPTFTDPCRLVMQSRTHGAPDGDAGAYAREVAPHSMHREEDFVVFSANATNLTDDVLEPGTGAVYRRDCNTATTELLFVADVSEIEYSPSRESFAFVTTTSLASGDTNGLPDVYLYSFDGAALQRLSVSSAGGEAAGMSYGVKPVRSEVGPVAWAFISDASLTGTGPGIFVRDPALATTQKIVTGLSGGFDASSSLNCILYKDIGGYLRFDPDFLDSDDGDYVINPDLISVPASSAFRSFALTFDCTLAAFVSADASLVGGDTNDFADVFVVNLATHSHHMVTAPAGELPSGGDALEVDIEYFSTGAYYVVAFSSEATNLTRLDSNGSSDIFASIVYSPSADTSATSYPITARWDVATATPTTTRGESRSPRIDAQGQLVTFVSRDSDFADGLVLANAVYTFELPWWI